MWYWFYRCLKWYVYAMLLIFVWFWQISVTWLWISLDFHRFVCSETDFQTKSNLAYQWHTCFNEVFYCVKSVHILSYSGPYSVRIGENVDQNNSEYGHFSRSVLFTKSSKERYSKKTPGMDLILKQSLLKNILGLVIDNN